MRGFNKVILAGNLTRDPETRAIASTGNSVTSFSLAVNRMRRDASGNNTEETSFFDCEAWGRQGETIAQYCKRGQALLVSGRLRQDTWADKDTGKNRSSIRVVVEDFNFLSGGNSDGGSYSGGSNSRTTNSAASAKTAPAAPSDIAPEDIPEGDINVDDIPF